MNLLRALSLSSVVFVSLAVADTFNSVQVQEDLSVGGDAIVAGGLSVAGGADLAGLKIGMVRDDANWLDQPTALFTPLGRFRYKESMRILVSEEGCGVGSSVEFYLAPSYIGTSTTVADRVRIYSMGDADSWTNMDGRIEWYVRKIDHSYFYLAAKHFGGCQGDNGKTVIYTVVATFMDLANGHGVEAGYEALPLRRYLFEEEGVTPELTVSGAVTAQNFIGDGSQLTGLAGGQIQTSGGNIGIGRAPTEKLDVGGDVWIRGTGGTIGGSNVANGALRVGNRLGMDENEIYFSGIDGNFGTTTANSLLFRTDGTFRMKLDANGNLGLGTASPITRFHVEGNSFFDGFVSFSPGAGRGLRFWNSDNYKIHMGNTSEYHYGPVSDYSIKTGMNDDPDRGWAWGVHGQTPVVAFNTRGDVQNAGDLAVMGRVGIGTSQPRGVLDISGPGDVYLTEATITGDLRTLFLPGHIFLAPRSGGNVSYLQARRQDNSGSTELQVRTYNQGSLVNALRIDEAGQVGIGITGPEARLDVNGSLRVRGDIVYDQPQGDISMGAFQ